MKDNIITLGNGRRLGYMEYGTENGTPFLLFHGTPGSRKWFTADDPIFEKYGLRVIFPERPGYGNSDPDKNRSIADWADDVTGLTDHLAIERSHIVGVSGGGPYALACASLIPDRIKTVSLIASFAPPGVNGYIESMTTGNRFLFFLTNRWPLLAGIFIHLMALFYKRFPGKIMKTIRSRLCESDLRVLDEGREKDLENILVTHMQEAFKNGIEGTMSDMALLSNDWKIDFSTINIPVFLWHGEADTLSPVLGGRHLATQVPSIESTFIPGAGHFLLEDKAIREKIIEKSLQFSF